MTLNLKKHYLCMIDFLLIFPLDLVVFSININFHYLQPNTRELFLRQLERFASDKNFDKKTRYNIKRYLFNQVRRYFKKDNQTLFNKTSENIIFKHNKTDEYRESAPKRTAILKSLMLLDL